ncbi:MAG: hypothetical protein R3F61_05400 [Myxococcota bacterium]
MVGFDPSQDPERSESRFGLLLLVLLLTVPILGGFGVLAMAVATAFFGA